MGHQDDGEAAGSLHSRGVCLKLPARWRLAVLMDLDVIITEKREHYS